MVAGLELLVGEDGEVDAGMEVCARMQVAKRLRSTKNKEIEKECGSDDRRDAIVEDGLMVNVICLCTLLSLPYAVLVLLYGVLDTYCGSSRF